MEPNKESFIVITKTTFEPEIKSDVIQLVADSKPIFEKQPGYRSFIPHISTDEGSTLTYMEWASEDDHKNCMMSPDFAEINPRWQGLFASGKAKIEFETYRVL